MSTIHANNQVCSVEYLYCICCVYKPIFYQQNYEFCEIKKKKSEFTQVMYKSKSSKDTHRLLSEYCKTHGV